MKKRQDNSARASALQIALSTALISISAILLASSFDASTMIGRGLVAKKSWPQPNPIVVAKANTAPRERDAYLQALQDQQAQQDRQNPVGIVSPNRTRTLSFADRVAYQRAIEEVYWRHRIWPAANAGPKPPLDKVMSQAEIEKKVEDYLRHSQALEDYWQRPITPDQLQAEMERIASHTKQPTVLRELFAALGNDPFVIAECLARPVLTERLLTELYAHDQRFHGELKRRAEAELRTHGSMRQMKQTSGMYTEIELARSDSGNADSAPTDGKNAGAICLNGSEWDENVQKLAAQFYNPQPGRARPELVLSEVEGGAPGTPRQNEAATGAEIVGRLCQTPDALARRFTQTPYKIRIAVGREPGDQAGDDLLAQIRTGVLSPLQEDDAHYYAVAVMKKGKDRLKLATVAWLKEPLPSWLAKAEAQVPVTMATVSANYTLPAIASPSGGCTDDTWTATSTTGAPVGRQLQTAVWTGSEMIVWGGFANPSYLNTGGRYNPSTDSWTATSTSNVPSAREYQTAVWTGIEMIVWGGWDGSSDFNTGGRYNPGTDNWATTSTTSAPAARGAHTAVWTGTEMIVWGGAGVICCLNTGGRYNPATDSWTATSTTNAPAGREYHTAVWTGSEMIVWGGFYSNGYLNTGGRYNPGTDSWATTSTTNAPDARFGHTAVWTGSEMIVWGGFTSSSFFNTGGRYNPGTDNWATTSTTSAPAARGAHTAVWTDSEMIVWGGYYYDGGSNHFLNTGGRYNPNTDSWTGTSITNAPDAREAHTAVWTGSEMIVWSGFNNNYLNTGGRYCAQQAPTLRISVHQVSPTAFPSRIHNLNGAIDDPLELEPSESLLRTTEPSLAGGLVADGVTPLLIQLDSTPAPTQTTTFTLSATVGGQPATWLNSYLRVHQTTGTPQFVCGNSVALSSSHPSGFAYISGIKSEDLPLNGNTELAVTLNATQTGQSNPSASVQFKIRRPPIVLVHGYSSDSRTWSDGGGDFLGTLQNAFPHEFIVQIDYGVDYSRRDPDSENRIASFVTLAQKLNDALPQVGASGPLRDWALTRYDLICHSQGGVLARMLCASEPGRFGIVVTPFKDLSNAKRGRFRRIVTIGAPQNGSTLYYYVRRVFDNPYFYGAGDRLLFYLFYGDLLQEKFNPFGDQSQIHFINDPNDNGKQIDPDAKFHVIRGALQGTPRIFRSVFLDRASIASVVIPNGSDGVVDFESQTGRQTGQAVNTASGSISHCCPSAGAAWAFGVSPGSTEPTSSVVASETISYLNGPSANVFAPFQLPLLLDETRKTAIDAVVPQSLLLHILGMSSMSIVHRADGSSAVVINLVLIPDPQEPIDGDVTWMAEVFGPNGASTDGLTLAVDPNDSTHATLTVEDSVQGDVVVYASYPSSIGHLVVGQPIVVLSRMAGANLVGVSLEPNDVTVSVGDTFTFQIWGQYDNGTSVQLFEGTEQPPQYTTSAPSVVSIGNRNQFTAVGAGQATITANFRGFSAQVSVSVSPVPTPTTFRISGNVSYCVGTGRPVPYVTLNLSGDSTGSATSNDSGSYQLFMPTGNYTVTPAALRDLQPVTDPSPDTGDALRVQQHVNSGGTLLTGCAELAAHTNLANPGGVHIGDALAIQQFVNNTVSANNGTGQWRFVPASRSYPNLASDQAAQNYDAYVLGDVTGRVIFPMP